MEGYIRCQICGKPLKVVNAAHLKTHNMTLEEYNQFIQRKKRKKSAKFIPTVITGTISGIVGNLLTPLVKSFLAKLSKLPKYLKGLKYKLIITILMVTVTSTVVIYKIHQAKLPLPPPKPEIPIEAENDVIPTDVLIDTTPSVFLEPPVPPLLQATALLPFRSKPTFLSDAEVAAMIKEYNFFDVAYNKNGKGFDNDFVLKKDDQVIYDRNSGLMWQKGGSDYWMTYEGAKTWVKKLDFAGYTDWRLPTLEEAMSLVEQETNSGGFYVDSKFDKTQKWIWTSDQSKGESYVWAVHFGDGGCYGLGLINVISYVRAVRSEQSSSK